MQNLYGDILSDVAAQIAGSVGLAGSSNIGDHCSMFEAIHGSAPDIAGKGIANPSGLLHGAIIMLNHIGQNKVAEKIMNAWLKTIEDGIHTADIYNPETSKKQVGTHEFAQAVIANLGTVPTLLKAVAYPEEKPFNIPVYTRKAPRKKTLVGVDVFLHWNSGTPDDLAKELNALELGGLTLNMISNRGLKVWPNGFEETFCTDHWRCRFTSKSEAEIEKADIIQVLTAALHANMDVIKTENLYEFDGKPAYSLGQGQ